jgi:hypothetical protein
MQRRLDAALVGATRLGARRAGARAAAAHPANCRELGTHGRRAA